MGKKIGKRIAAVLMGAVLLFNLLTAVFHATELKSRIGWLPLTFLTVETGSMEPVLSAGDLLIDWEAPYNSLHPGDIVTFHQGNDLVTHEIVRWEGSRLVTKGRANSQEDASIGPEEYCAKVIAVLPGFGAALSYMTNPFILLAAVLILAFLFFGKDLLELLTGQKEEKEDASGQERKKLKETRPLRLMGMLTLASVFCITPFLTAAKYAATINTYTSLTSVSQYLTSNCMSRLSLDQNGQMTGGESYMIEGWAGRGYGLQLSIRNYANALLYNRQGVDTVFGLRAVKVASEGTETYRTEYEVELIPDASVVSCQGQQNNPEEGETDGTTQQSFSFPAVFPSGDDYGPYLLEGSDEHGKSAGFTVQLTVNEDVTFQPGDQVRFQLYACTSQTGEFDIRLKGDYSLVVAASQDFINSRTINTSDNSSLVTYTITTNLVSGSGTRNVSVEWDNTLLYLNEYEKTAFNIINTRLDNYVSDDGNGHGHIILPLQAYSSISLQLFKRDNSSDIDGTKITATEMTDDDPGSSPGDPNGDQNGGGQDDPPAEDPSGE